jgi:transcriptional regulator with XRE-family HTH domain
MPRDLEPDDPPPDVNALTDAAESRLGVLIRTDRRRRDLTLSELGRLAGVSTTSVHAVESGRRATLGMYIRLAAALGRRLEFDLDDPSTPGEAAVQATDERDRPRPGRDIVHAAMGEIEVARLLAHGRAPGIDVPWQHYRFGGRADVLACDSSRRALAYIENKGELSDVQEALGRFNEAQGYLGVALWERLGMVGPPLVETHVMVALWSADVIDVVRRHPATFLSAFPDPPDAFLAWWSGGVPPRGRTAAFVLLDPFAAGRARRFAGLSEVLAGIQPRVAGYAAAAELVRRDRARAR